MQLAEKTTWHCTQCSWVGHIPSMTDASYVRLNYEGELIIDRVHIPVCPLDFVAVRREPRHEVAHHERVRS